MQISSNKRYIPLSNIYFDKSNIKIKFAFYFVVTLIIFFLILTHFKKASSILNINLSKKSIDNEQNEINFMKQLKLILILMK